MRIDSRGFKRCPSCKIEYENPFEAFDKDRSKVDGLCGECKKCLHGRNNKYTQTHKTEKRDYMQRYNQEHLEENREYTQEYDLEHREDKRDYMREYHRANPQVSRAFIQRRRALKRERDDGTVTSSVVKQMLDECGRRCMNTECGATSHLSIDHIVALDGPSKGWHTVGNIQILCRSCNSLKGTKTIDYRPSNWPWLTREGSTP
jgi:5-methylcytosine-specific restriction endonuclease McrA